ncbi:hypothetical protein WMF26_12970 [Sorangium sp. So ce185]|uniref:hypothetical protein n=1 Tax=Sorangium sp. So ce185 TaxID=3133287 RepID=UPI003F61E812
MTTNGTPSSRLPDFTGRLPDITGRLPDITGPPPDITGRLPDITGRFGARHRMDTDPGAAITERRVRFAERGVEHHGRLR